MSTLLQGALPLLLEVVTNGSLSLLLKLALGKVGTLGDLGLGLFARQFD